MSYNNLLVYFFTGTGNSYRVASWMVESARQQGLTARAVAIDAAAPENEVAGPGQLIGLVCPTHAFTAPWAMLRFALRLPWQTRLPGQPRRRGASAFSVLTRGGVKAGRVYIPGLEGSGAYLLALILALKGYRVVGANGVDMPVNWTALIPGLTKPNAELIIERAKLEMQRFLQTMLAGKTAFRSFLALALGILLLPITFAYLVMGRFFLSKLFYASPNCDGCGLCARSCPVQAIRMKGRQPRPYWTFLCESCARCMNYCPKNAVEASYPFGAIAFYAASIPVAAVGLDWLARWVAQAAGWKGTLVETIIQYPYKLLAIAAAYFIFSLVLRIPIANRLFTLVTPTHYYRRYREPGTRLGEIARK